MYPLGIMVLFIVDYETKQERTGGWGWDRGPSEKHFPFLGNKTKHESLNMNRGLGSQSCQVIMPEIISPQWNGMREIEDNAYSGKECAVYPQVQRK